MVKNLPANAEDMGLIPGSKDPLKEGMTTHFSILAWEIPCTEEPEGLQLRGSQRVGHNLVTSVFTFFHFQWIHRHIVNLRVKESKSEVAQSCPTLWRPCGL